MARLTNKQNNDNTPKASSRRANSPTRSKEAVQPHHDIPKFDLAEQILAEQRKLSTVRRKGPGKRAKAPTSQIAKPAARPIETPLILSEPEQIITEIVARDIESLIEGDASSPQS